jgi:energy-converting hydrogenase A subunit M
MTLFYLPMDSRPCNTLFPVQLLNCAGVSCKIPPEEAVDYFTRPSDPGEVTRFLEEAAKEGGTLILSVDKLVFDSLLASREDSVTLEEALAKLHLISRLKKNSPRLKVIAFNVLLRSSTSTLKLSDVRHHHAVTAYSQARHRAVISGLPEDLRAVEEIANEIPSVILDKYLFVRERNHAVNLECLSMAKENVFDRLLLLQEDSQPLGLHRLEQQAVMRELGGVPDERITLCNGADEAGCICAAYAAAKPLKLYIHPLGGDSLSFTAKYEDRPFMENIESHARFAGIELTSREDADKILCVLAPFGPEQRDALLPTDETEEERARLTARAEELAGLINGSRPIGLLDVYYANGGSYTFCRELARRFNLLSLEAYAAWNTASNSLGTVLAQLALGRDKEKSRLFTAERLSDDLLYQSTVRHMLQEALQASGEDPYHLKDKAAAERLLNEYMREVAVQSGFFDGYSFEAVYSLPWPRTFEVLVDIHGGKEHERKI